MYDEMSMGTTAPWNEECVQVGEDGYLERAREEAQRFIELIRQKLGPEPPGARLRVKSCPHDFGTYLDVVVGYATEDEEAAEYAYLCESEGPRTWDDSAPLSKKPCEVTGYLEASVSVEAVSVHMAEVQGKRIFREKAKAAGLNDMDIDVLARKTGG